MGNSIKQRIRLSNVIFLFIAGVINATGIMLLLAPAKLFDSGVSGLSMFISNVSGINIAVFLLVINFPLFLIGRKKLGNNFLICSFIAIGTYALMSFVYSGLLHLNDKVSELIMHDIFIAAVFGGFLSGLGSGLTIRNGGAIDGIEVLAVMYSKKIGLSVGQFVMIFNLVIYTLGSITEKSLLVGLYSVISYFIGLKVIDFIVDGFDKGKSFTIITEDPDKISAALSQELGRGLTLIECKGYFSKENKTMLYCVANRFEITRLKRIISEIDPDCFVAITEVSEVSGNRIQFSMSNMRNNYSIKKPSEKKENGNNTIADKDIVKLNDENLPTDIPKASTLNCPETEEDITDRQGQERESR